MVDTGKTAGSLAATWLSIGRRAAVGGGAAVALVALWNDVNLWMASLRGGLTCIAVLVLAKYAARALHWSANDPALPRKETIQ
jgi:hypothetical protein